MKHQGLIIYFIFFLCFSLHVYSQNPDKRVIQFSGVVVTEDSLKPLPFVTITVKKSSKATVSNFFGFFSLPVDVNDTVEFSSVGLKKTYCIIPDTLKEKAWSILKEMKADTILLKTAIVYPRIPLEQFKHVFLHKKLPDDDLERARKNLDRASMKMLYNGLAMDGSMNHKNYMQQHAAKIYYAGQSPPNNLLNPLAWAEFINDWQEGKLKIKAE